MMPPAWDGENPFFRLIGYYERIVPRRKIAGVKLVEQRIRHFVRAVDELVTTPDGANKNPAISFRVTEESQIHSALMEEILERIALPRVSDAITAFISVCHRMVELNLNKPIQFVSLPDGEVINQCSGYPGEFFLQFENGLYTIQAEGFIQGIDSFDLVHCVLGFAAKICSSPASAKLFPLKNVKASEIIII